MDPTVDPKHMKLLNSFKSGFGFQTLSVLGFAWSNYQSIGKFNLPPIVNNIIWIVIAAYVCVYAVKYLKRLNSQELPPADGEFTPLSRIEDRKIWDRAEVTADLAKSVRANSVRHTLVVSPSGTGKSTMINKLLPQALDNYRHISITEYHNVIVDVLVRMAEGVGAKRTASAVMEISRHMERRGSADDTLKALFDEVLNSVAEKESILLCFDQVERYFLQVDNDNSMDYADIIRRNDIIKLFLSYLARYQNIRTVFAIRSEYIFGSLSSMFNSNANGNDIDKYIEFYFLWGINNSNDEAIVMSLQNKIEARFKGQTIRKKLFRIAMLEHQSKANTFLLSMGGYLFEKLFNDERKKYKKRLSDAELSADNLLDIYLDAAFEGLVAFAGSADRTLFDTVLYSLASETKVSGQACEIVRLSGLSHYPVEDIVAVTHYLAGINLIEEESRDGERAYRITHEKIADRILKSDKAELDSRAIDGIRYLTENRIETGDLTIPPHFPVSVETSVAGWLNPSYVAVAMFVFFGVLRLIAPQETYHLINFTGLYTLVTRFCGYSLHDYYFQPQFYVAHFMTHVAWVSYIDRVNRAFMQNVAPPWIKTVCNSLAAVGAMFGIAVAYTPELFCIPIVVVGLIYGILLAIMSRYSAFTGQIKDITWKWGYRTLMNVGAVLVLSLFIGSEFDTSGSGGWFVRRFSEADRPNYVLFFIVVEATALLWFWQHIKAEQNTRKIWSANLALFDKGGVVGNSH